MISSHFKNTEWVAGEGSHRWIAFKNVGCYAFHTKYVDSFRLLTIRVLAVGKLVPSVKRGSPATVQLITKEQLWSMMAYANYLKTKDVVTSKLRTRAPRP